MGSKLFIILLIFTLNLSATQRLISLSPSITEILFGLEKGEQMVATSSYSLFPPEAQKLPIIGGYQNPNIEKILSYRPTLVIGQSFNKNTLEKLKKFHIKTLSLNLKTIPNIQKSILILGEILNAKSQAIKLTTNITNAITDAKKSKKPHSVMIVYGLKEDLRSRTYIAGHNIFYEEIISACGNSNAYIENSTSQPVLGYENIIALNPDQIIILHSHATEPDINVTRALASWHSLPTNASRNKKISVVDENYLHIPSHRIALTIKRLCTEMND
ncbi:MAG: helical backbone metal receptor [Campylobacterota bacterium]|nr:helical backbone metal receptor [Campylobacterota bacterium]